MHPHTLTIALVASCTVATGVGRAQTEVERRVPAAADGTVEIHNVAGSVTVTGWDRDEVQVTGTLGRGVEDLAVDGGGKRTRIEVRLPRRSHRGGDAYLAIRAPRGSALSIEVVSADVEVAEVAGPVEVEAVSGDIEVDGAPRSVDLETVSGDIEVRGPVARARAETVSGDLRLLDVGGEIEASAVSGSLEIACEAIARADLESVSGSIDLTGALAPRGVVEASSHSGSIELRLPATTAARFRATTFSGRIRNELGPPSRRVGRYTPEEELDFTLGSGDGRVSLETFSGDVTLRPR